MINILKHKMLLVVLAIMIVVINPDPTSAATPKADYLFNSTLASSVGTAPSLTDLGAGTNAFVTETPDGITRTVLSFPKGNGLQFTPTTNVISNGSYSIVMLFRLNNVYDQARVIDFENGVADTGFYIWDGIFRFRIGYNSSTTVAANTYVQVVVTRDAQKKVAVYVDGALQPSFTDTEDVSLISAANTLRFFKDNDTEESAGAVARIRLYDVALTATEAANLDRLPAAPPPTVSINDVTLNEGNVGPTNATFTASLSSPATQTVTVNYATANGTATAGSDYTTTSGTLTFAIGVTTKTFTVPIISDTAIEPDETFLVNLSAPTNATLADSQGVCTITTDENLEPISWWRGENNAQDIIGTNDGTITGGVTFVPGQPYRAVDSGQAFNFDGTGQISIPDNATMKPANLTIMGWIKPSFAGRPREYGDDDVILQKSLSGVGYSLFLTQDPTIQYRGADSAVPLATPSFQLQVNGTTHILFSQDSSIPNDGLYHHVTATFDGTGMKIYIDGVPKGENSFSGIIDHYNGTAYIGLDPDNCCGGISERNAVAAIDEVRLFNRALSAAEIPPYVGASPLTVTVTPRIVNEMDGANAAIGTVTRSGSTAASLTVNLSSSDATEATVPTSVQIPAGSASATFPIAAVQDNTVDGSQPVAIMARATGFLSGTASLLVKDSPLVTINDMTVNEGQSGATTATFTVSLSAANTQPVTVNYETANNTATAGSDYVAKTGTLTFAANTSSLTQNVVITINGDTIVEPDETFFVNLSAPTNALLGDAQGIGTITNDESVQAGSLQFSSPTYSVSESGPVATLSVTRTGGSSVAVSVSYATANGTATAPGDYTAKTGTLSWAAGDGAAKTITVAIVDDALVESNETFTVTLSAPTGGAVIGTPSQATVTIADNDSPPPTADGGPLVLMGIDAEDGGVGTHGPIANYVTVVNSILGKVANGGQGILVIGGGKSANDDVTSFWNAIATGTGKPVTYVNGATNIGARSFAGFAMIAVASSVAETASGGLTQAENDALATRRTAVATFVNTGGGLLGFSQSGLTTPYPYIEGFGTFTFNTGLSYSDITPTPAGQAIGITDALDLSFWHDEYLTFPSFLGILATNTVSDKPAAIGGASVVIGSAIRINDVSIVEGNSSAKTLTFTATLSQASAQTITVNYATANGITNPATAGSDYIAKTGTLTFAPGVTNQPVAITINSDTIVEPNETFFVNLTNAVNATIGDARGVGTITNDDTATPGTLQFSVTAYTVAESSDTATITVTRTAGSSGAVGVTYATSNGTATSGSDYVAKTGTLSWAVGDSAPKTFTLQILNDTLAEADETINLALSLPTGGATMGTPGSAQLTILDNDSAPGCSNVFTDSDLEAALNPAWTIQNSTHYGTPILSNSNGGTSAWGPKSGTKWACFFTTADPGTANLGRSVTLPAGAQVTLTFGLWIGQITSPFTDELRVKVDGTTVKTYTEPGVSEAGYSTRTVDLSSFANGATHTIVFEYMGEGNAVSTFFNIDDVELEVCTSTVAPKSLSINDVSVLEGSSVNFTVTLSAPSTQNVSVQYATGNGSAAAPGDYSSKTGTLSIPAGQTKGIINIVTVGDTLDELDETFFVNLSAPSGATISDTQGRATIIDNDSAPTLSINDVTITESDTGVNKNALFTITLSAPSGRTVSVNAIPANGSAKSPADYTSGGANLSFAPGQTSKTFSVPVVGDSLDEDAETFFVLLSSPVNAATGRGRGVCTINDNDLAPSITIEHVNIGEGNGGQRTAVFRLHLSAPSGKLVKVNYATGPGTATVSNDYVAVASTQIAFTTGQTVTLARVLINGDVFNEPNETFKVNLTSPLNATIADAQAIGTILNDDTAPALSIDDVSITEGNSGTKNLTFTVSLSAVSGQTITVNYATADGVAKAGSDYLTQSGPLTFAAGQTSKTISVPVIGDTTAEGNETFFVLLSGATNASIGRARATGTISNDDASG